MKFQLTVLLVAAIMLMDCLTCLAEGGPGIGQGGAHAGLGAGISGSGGSHDDAVNGGGAQAGMEVGMGAGISGGTHGGH